MAEKPLDQIIILGILGMLDVLSVFGILGTQVATTASQVQHDNNANDNKALGTGVRKNRFQ